MCCVKLYEYLSISVKRSKIMLDTIPCCRGEKNCISPQCNAVRITKKFTETPMHRCWRQNWMHWKSQPLYSFVAYSLHALSACAFTDNFFSISLSLSLSLRVALVKSIRKKREENSSFSFHVRENNHRQISWNWNKNKQRDIKHTFCGTENKNSNIHLIIKISAPGKSLKSLSHSQESFLKIFPHYFRMNFKSPLEKSSLNVEF